MRRLLRLLRRCAAAALEAMRVPVAPLALRAAVARPPAEVFLEPGVVVRPPALDFVEGRKTGSATVLVLRDDVRRVILRFAEVG